MVMRNEDAGARGVPEGHVLRRRRNEDVRARNGCAREEEL